MRHAIYPYLLFGYGLLDQVMNLAAFEISRLLENLGHVTLPIPVSMPNDPLALQGTLSHKHAAVAAGFGEFGWTSLLLTPEGSQLRLTSIITEAEMEPSPLYSGPELCNPERCGFLCAEVCPMNAIPKGEEVECRIDGKIFRYGKLDKWSCRWGQHGLTTATLGRKDIPRPDVVTRERYLEALKNMDPWQAKEQSPMGRVSFCSRCQLECPVGKPADSPCAVKAGE
jgi:epoxyqueuosine reductase QueG